MKTKSAKRTRQSAAGKRRPVLAIAAVLAAAAAAAVCAWWIAGRGDNAPIAAGLGADFSDIKGRWVRPDGGYVIEIKNVDDAGTMEAAYFNPSPIHIARAQASWNAGSIQVFIELRDVNYPGSTYSLKYGPADDRLKGSYYQAVAGETYAIFFERAR